MMGSAMRVAEKERMLEKAEKVRGGNADCGQLGRE
jgi:hypothetical protein